MNKNEMIAKDGITGSLGKCYVTIENNRYFLMQAKNIKANFNKSKVKLGILGKTGKGNKTTGWDGTGNATFYYNTSIFRRLFKRYKDTGKDIYFDMQVTNDDPSSDAGRQTVILKDCNLDGGILAMFDVDTEVLEESADFTFEDFDIPEEFNDLPGMLQ
jgi:hypothetical protein